MSDGSGAEGLRTGEVASAAGVNVQTLRYYERRGLLAPQRRSPGGHRRYDDGDVTALRAIKAAQRLGFTLAEAGELLAAGRDHRHGSPTGGAGGGGGLHARAAAKLAEVDARIAELAAVRAKLAAALEARCDDLVACAADPCCPLPLDGPANVRLGSRR